MAILDAQRVTMSVRAFVRVGWSLLAMAWEGERVSTPRGAATLSSFLLTYFSPLRRSKRDAPPTL